MNISRLVTIVLFTWFVSACASGPRYPTGTIAIGDKISDGMPRYLTVEESYCAQRGYMIVEYNAEGVMHNRCAIFLTAIE